MSPMDRSRYPANWKEIATRVKDAAGWCCQVCGVGHRTKLLRDNPDSYGVWRQRVVEVILTVHHIGAPKPDGSPGDPADKLDCRDENLIALCQRCHLRADREHHIQTRERNRIEREASQRRAGGQKGLWE
jgi:hypothetical protein